MNGPLAGLKVVALAGLGPVPFCSMLLADLGADVVRVDRPGATGDPRVDVLGRGQRSVALDLKSAAGVRAVLAGIERAEVLLEGFRPGVAERLGLGPEVCLARNPRLVYGRMTGWGQDGPLAHAAGHDINYIALAGALAAIGTPERPIPPINLVGDYGGGGMMLAFGVVSAVLSARATGRGQVVDAAMIDGAALMLARMFGLRAEGRWGPRATNLFDGGAPFYDTYRCADGRWIAIGPLEPQFFAALADRLGLDGGQERENWPGLRRRLEAIFASRDRDAWCALLEGTDACFAPVLDFDEAPKHPHNLARRTFIEVAGVTQPAPAPRFQGTPASDPGSAPAPGADTAAVLAEWGLG